MIQSGWNLNSTEILRLSWIPASLAKIRSKMTEKRWRHHFPHYKSMEAFACHDHSFDPICPKTKCNLNPMPLMLQFQFDQDWPTGLRDTHVRKCKCIRNFWRSRARNSKVTDLIRPNFKLIGDCMPVLVTSKFEEDPIKNEGVSLETPNC